MNADYQKAMYAAKKRLGICTICGTSPSHPKRTSCLGCKARNRMIKRVATRLKNPRWRMTWDMVDGAGI